MIFIRGIFNYSPNYKVISKEIFFWKIKDCPYIAFIQSILLIAAEAVWQKLYLKIKYLLPSAYGKRPRLC